MAINNTNTVSTLAGVDSTSSYIRIEAKLLPNGRASIKYFVYPSKAEYTAGASPVTHAYDEIYNRFLTDVLLPSEITIDNLHDLAIAKLVARGMDNTKLAKVDLV
jgi:hypothetical protein